MKKNIVIFAILLSILALYVSNGLKTVSAAQAALSVSDMENMTQQELSQNVLRLHIRANSNSDADQAVKLQIRDAVINEYQTIFAQMDNLGEAAAFVAENEAEICRFIDDYLKNAGYDYTCEIKLERCVFPEKTYDTLTFPAGEYLAVNIALGSGTGDNWWCVLFPPLCFLNAYQDDALPENKIQMKWKIAELIESWFKK